LSVIYREKQFYGIDPWMGSQVTHIF